MSQESPSSSFEAHDPTYVDRGIADMVTPTIVVVAFDRPKTLERLLRSLRKMRVPEAADVRLVISVDDSVPDTMEVALRYEWPFGSKELIGRDTRLGLRAHVLACGDLTTEYGTILMLEDDLYASPDAYRFARTAAAFYRSNEHVAGVSLYAYRLDEFLRMAFRPLDDGFDTYFMRMASSWGQVWTPRQWEHFRTWRHPTTSTARLPQNAAKWDPERSWKRSFLEYMIDTDRYFVFPRTSLTSNCGDAGEHFRASTTNFITPLTIGPREWRLAPWTSRAIRYDAWFEPSPSTLSLWWPKFAENATIDFRGLKLPDQVSTPQLLSIRECAAPAVSFPIVLQPEAMNLGLPGEGSFFHLGPTAAFGKVSGRKRRRMIETLNGEIDPSTATGILADRLAKRLRID